MSKFSVDEIDKKILSFLIGNARMPFLEIARECGISGAAVHQRVKKLEEAGVIAGSRLEINPKALGYDVAAYVGIQISEANLFEDVVTALKNIPSVVECNFLTGRYAIFIKVYCRDNSQLMHIITDTIYSIKGVTQTETFLSLAEGFERQVSVEALKAES